MFADGGVGAEDVRRRCGQHRRKQNAANAGKGEFAIAAQTAVDWSEATAATGPLPRAKHAVLRCVRHVVTAAPGAPPPAARRWVRGLVTFYRGAGLTIYEGYGLKGTSKVAHHSSMI